MYIVSKTYKTSVNYIKKVQRKIFRPGDNRALARNKSTVWRSVCVGTFRFEVLPKARHNGDECETRGATVSVDVRHTFWDKDKEVLECVSCTKYLGVCRIDKYRHFLNLSNSLSRYVHKMGWEKLIPPTCK